LDRKGRRAIEAETTGMVKEEVGGEEVKSKTEKGRVNKKVKIGTKLNQNESQRKSLMELLVICTPLLNVLNIFYAVLYYLSLDMPILLISIFPAQSRNVIIILLCLSCDSLIFSFLLAWGVYTLFIIVSFVLTVDDFVDLAIQKISRYN